MTPPLLDRGPSRLRGRSRFGAAKARPAAVYPIWRPWNSPRLDRATYCGRGPPALRRVWLAIKKKSPPGWRAPGKGIAAG